MNKSDKEPDKPRNSYPPLIRRLLKKLLPKSQYIRYIGRHDNESMRLWSYLSANVSADKAILDIGAFRGKYALASRQSNLTAKVYAFEPNPITAETLRITCEKNRIELEEVAIAERSGLLPFLLNSARSKICESSPLQDKLSYVPAVSLDSWVNDNTAIPSLIKIDVEGAEASVLRGAGKVLYKYEPIILCEILTNSEGTDVMAALPPQYQFYYIDENKSIEKRSQIKRIKWRNLNWLLAPSGRENEIHKYLNK